MLTKVWKIRGGLMLLGFGGCLLAALAGRAMYVQAQAGERISAGPVRTTATVTRIVLAPRSATPDVYLDYAVGGRHYVTKKLDLSHLPTPASRGEHICLEAAASSPRTIRLCGQTYPAPDAFQTEGLGATAGVIAAGVAAVVLRTVERDRRRAGAEKPAAA